MCEALMSLPTSEETSGEVDVTSVGLLYCEETAGCIV